MPTEAMVELGARALELRFKDRVTASDGRVLLEGYFDLSAISRAVLEAVEAASGGEGWREIESAPKDGTRVIIGRAGNSSDEARFDGGWFSISSDASGYNPWRVEPPTHWQPVPLPPAVKG